MQQLSPQSNQRQPCIFRKPHLVCQPNKADSPVFLLTLRLKMRTPLEVDGSTDFWQLLTLLGIFDLTHHGLHMPTK